MKKNLAIIAEYNPFHNGHKYHIKTSLQKTGLNKTIIIMSGNFVQRGEPAIVDYKKRAKMAIESGADLVLKLPTYFSTASADYFSYGAIKLLNELNIPVMVSFGSESGKIENIKKIGKYLSKYENQYYKQVRRMMSEGVSIAKAREKFLTKIFGDVSKILKGSNNILGIEYIKNAHKLECSNIKFITIKRKGPDYNCRDSINNIMSATGIRQSIKTNNNNWKQAVPKETIDIMNNSFVYVNQLFKYIKYTVLKEKYSITKYRGVIEGLENLLLDKIDNINNYNNFLTNVVSKRYAKTSIKRMFLSIFLGITKKNFKYIQNRYYPFIEVIDFNNTGKKILKQINLNSNIPLIHNINKYPWKNYYCLDFTMNLYKNLEIKANKIYNILYGNRKEEDELD